MADCECRPSEVREVPRSVGLRRRIASDRFDPLRIPTSGRLDPGGHRPNPRVPPQLLRCGGAAHHGSRRGSAGLRRYVGNHRHRAGRHRAAGSDPGCHGSDPNFRPDRLRAGDNSLRSGCHPALRRWGFDLHSCAGDRRPDGLRSCASGGCRGRRTNGAARCLGLRMNGEVPSPDPHRYGADHRLGLQTNGADHRPAARRTDLDPRRAHRHKTVMSPPVDLHRTDADRRHRRHRSGRSRKAARLHRNGGAQCPGRRRAGEGHRRRPPVVPGTRNPPDPRLRAGRGRTSHLGRNRTGPHRQNGLSPRHEVPTAAPRMTGTAGAPRSSRGFQSLPTNQFGDQKVGPSYRLEVIPTSDRASAGALNQSRNPRAPPKATGTRKGPPHGGGPFLRNIPAATYSPRESPPKYHRRGQA